MTSLVRSLAVAAALSASLLGQRMLCCNSTGEVYEVDVTNGATSQLGRLSANVGTAAGFAYDLTEGRLLVTSTSNDALYVVDMSDWSARLLGTYGGPTLMHGIEWDFFTATLYGADAAGALFTIDADTGAATQLATLPFGSSSLGFDPFGATMYLADVVTDCLYTVDTATGATSLVGPLVNSVSPSCLAFDVGRGQLFLADNVTDNLYVVDEATGEAVVVGPLTPGDVLGMAFVPGDGQMSRDDANCGGASMFATGYPNIGGQVDFSLDGVVGVGLVGFGMTRAALPFCGCVIGHEWAVAEVGPTVRFVIPAVSSAIGAQFHVQGADVFAGSGCGGMALTLTDTVTVTVGG